MVNETGTCLEVCVLVVRKFAAWLKVRAWFIWWEKRSHVKYPMDRHGTVTYTNAVFMRDVIKYKHFLLDGTYYNFTSIIKVVVSSKESTKLNIIAKSLILNAESEGSFKLQKNGNGTIFSRIIIIHYIPKPFNSSWNFSQITAKGNSYTHGEKTHCQ